MDTKTFEAERKHDFTRKLRQAGVFEAVVDYIAWQKKVRQAKANGQEAPVMPGGRGPISINLDLTTACNYSCTHCIDWDILNSPIKYNHDNLKMSLQNMINLGLRSVILIGGGEATIYPGFGDIVRFLKERNVQVAIVSNGSRNQVIYDIAGKLTSGDWVRLSLDAGINDTFVRMHNPAKAISLEAICEWVPRIHILNPVLPVAFSFIITWEGSNRAGEAEVIPNIEEMITATKLARDYQFNYISFKPFLTRRPSGTEVMDTTLMHNFDKTIVRIREAITEAKTYETEKFKVIESTNLRVLLRGNWQDFTRQPKTCHMQAFRQVLSPLGLFNCPAYRGAQAGYIGNARSWGNSGQNGQTQKLIADIIDRFDASHECKEITCLYNPVNLWLERAVTGEINESEFEAIVQDQEDFFL